MTSPAELAAPAWHAPAFNPLNRYTVGVLQLADGRLSYRTNDAVQFDVPVTELHDVKFAYGDSLLKCEAAGKKWRFFFARPAGAPAATAAGGVVAGAAGAVAAVAGTKSILDSRKVGKQFRAALGG